MSIGSLIVTIGADISSIRRDSKRGADSLGSLEGSAKTLGTALKAIAVGAFAKKLQEMVSTAMDAVDANAKLSRQLGGTINGLQGLKLAASEAGVSAGALTSAAEMLNRRLGEAARKGSGEAHDALTTLGLDARELAAMDLDVRMASIADAIQKAGLSSQGTADVLGRLGIRQGEFTRLLLDGGDALRSARTAIDDMGLSLSEVDAAKVEAANDAIARVKLSSTAIAQQLAVQLSPVITTISNQILDVAQDTGSLQRTVRTAVEYGVKGFGFLGDAIRGTHIVIKTLELATWSLGSGVVDVFLAAQKTIDFFVELAVGRANDLIEALNVIPGIDITPIALKPGSPMQTALEEFSLAMHATTAGIIDEIKTLATEEWPSDKAEKFFAKIQAAAQQAAENVTNARRELMSFGGEGDGGDGAESEAAEKEADKLRERLAGQLDVLREHIMTEAELEDERYAQRLGQLNAALDQELVSLSEYARIAEGLEHKHMDALASIRGKGLDRVNQLSVDSVASGVKQITGWLSSMTASAARENREMFELHKVFAIADALISGAMGVAKTMGAYPYPVNLGFAAAHAAMAAAQVAVIASQQFKGGSRGSVAAPGVRGGASGGGAAAGVASAGSAGTGGGISGESSQLVSINIQGDTFGRATVIALIEELNEAVSDGARIVVG